MDDQNPAGLAQRSGPPAYDASLADHGLEAKEFRGLTYPLGDHAPGYGDYFAIAPGLGWTRLPVPGSLDHINIWLLDDRDEHGDGVAIVDTGLYMPVTTDAWKKLFAEGLAGRRITRVFCHPFPSRSCRCRWLAMPQAQCAAVDEPHRMADGADADIRCARRAPGRSARPDAPGGLGRGADRDTCASRAGAISRGWYPKCRSAMCGWKTART